ncbi:MAG: beta galactosidase jelly roll domain-containing protein [Chitinispirillaceae bacterium]|nr:beta galactosidase jelly roll domain-containing protein [Chitinispirillaceae bacterium]
MHVSFKPAAAITCASLLVFLVSAWAEFPAHRIYKVRKKVSLNQGWKFQNDVTGDAPKDIGFNDASWPTVNVPHSAKYAAPTNDAERATMPKVGNWSGITWYRKSFEVPADAPAPKVYLEFEGAMSSAEVWLNGTRIGEHMNGGFTGFWFDATAAVNRSGTNLLAVRLDCNYRHDVPPGKLDSTNNEYPDFLLFSGIHRDVWVVYCSNVHIPPYGQMITTPVVSASSGNVMIRTTVRNDSSAALPVTVRSVVVDDQDNIITDKSAAATAAANGLSLVDMTTETITNIKRWSPETPVLYRVFTKVSVGDRVVDDHAERFGFRTLEWRLDGGFYLNGSRCFLKGVNMHNEFAWVGHALPTSRYGEEVRLAKQMGANAIRCAHYPRDPALYDACDEIGMICEPELPSWGGQTTDYPSVFWTRMTAAAKEMVAVGYNHPSIIMWGVFNEAPLTTQFETRFKALHATIKALDTTRFTSNINNKWYPTGSDAQNGATDIHGLNYAYPTDPVNIRLYNAEYAHGWERWCTRGATASSGNNYSEDDFAKLRWTGGDAITPTVPDFGWVDFVDLPKLGGAHMWVFVDYWSANIGLSHPMGAVDHYRIPKKVYYTFKTNWTGAADDYPANGLTAAKIQLDADVTRLVADSTDLSIIVASIRDASNRCVWASPNVTFTVTGPVDVFEGNPVTRAAIAGKIGIVVKSRLTPGTVTVIATSGSLSQGTVTLTAVSPDNSPLPFIWPGTGAGPSRNAHGSPVPFSIRQGKGKIVVSFARHDHADALITLFDLKGKTIRCPARRSGRSVILDAGVLGKGMYRIGVVTGDRAAFKNILIAR